MAGMQNGRIGARRIEILIRVRRELALTAGAAEIINGLAQLMTMLRCLRIDGHPADWIFHRLKNYGDMIPMRDVVAMGRVTVVGRPFPP